MIKSTTYISVSSATRSPTFRMMSCKQLGNESRGSYRVENNVLIGEDSPLIDDCNNIGEKVLDGLKKDPDMIGQIDDFLDKRTTCREMRERSVKCALWLKKQGVRAGDVVAVCTHNHIDTYIPCFAALYIGAVLNPWDHEMTVSSARRFLRMISPKIVFANERSAETIRRAIDAEELPRAPKIVLFGRENSRDTISSIFTDESLSPQVENFECAKLPDSRQTALILYSSGTTGLPKATQLSHFCVINQIARFPLIKEDDGNIFLCFSPPFWLAGPYLMIHCAMLQKTRIIYPEFHEEEAARLIEKYKVDWMLLGISMSHRIIKSNVSERYDLSSVKSMLIGGSILDAESHKLLMKIFPEALILHVYGMTEYGGAIALQKRGQKPGSNGNVAQNCQLKIVDVETGATLGPNRVGEIYIKSNLMMTGYYKDPAGTKQILDSEGWLHSGDLGYWDEDCELFIVDRIKELMKYRGYHVSPTEIENVLRKHPAVAEVSVVSVPHPIDEEHPIAFVAKLPGKEVTEEELCRLVEENLADQKRLRAGVRFVDKIPQTTSGKVARKQLKELARKILS